MTELTNAGLEVQSPWLDELLGRDGVSRLAEEMGEQLQRDVKGKFEIKTPSLLVRALTERLPSELHVNLLDFLAEGWNAASELETCRRRSQEQPNSTVVAALGSHSISRELKPMIRITYVGSKSFDIDAAIALEGAFDGVELSFRNGVLVSAGSGHCEAAVKLKIGEKVFDHPIVRHRWSLPGHYNFTHA